MGGINVGGSGKTPVATEIARILKKNRKTYCFLTKGYGGTAKGVKKLGAYSNDVYIVGDEALLLFEHGDTFISKNRVAGLKYINDNHKYDYIIMDDGLQNPTFHKDINILVIDGEYGFGNGLVIPAGPLRESFSSANRNIINLVIIIGEDRQNISSLCNKYSLPVIYGKIEPTTKNFDKKYIAFCGIGHPEKFRKTLVDNDVAIVDFIIFDDHHIYNNSNVDDLKKLGYPMITTKKDWVKIKSLNIDKTNIHVLEIRIDFDNVAAVENVLLANKSL
ncbi:tetraacyldisaccharide 4'-kinase [Bacilli bacterium]|nr:tetraacyldisaccharide 4'-kinase [Bacilli bacterium]